MMKRFALMLMLLLPLVAGCLTDSGDDDDDNDGGGTGLSAATYLPLKNGATFDYTETSYWYDDDEPDVSEYTSSIAGPVSKNGKSYYMMIDVEVDDPDWPDTTYIRVSGNTLYELDTFWNTAKAARKTEHTLPKIADEFGDYVDVPFIKFDAASWTIHEDSETGEGYSWDYSWTGKYLRKEDVTVPAGTFTDCPVFQLTMSEEGTYTYEDMDPYTYSWESKITMWWAANVGWVKSTSVEREYNEESESMEVYYSDTTVLDSYNIP